LPPFSPDLSQLKFLLRGQVKEKCSRQSLRRVNTESKNIRNYSYVYRKRIEAHVVTADLLVGLFTAADGAHIDTAIPI